jgi:drug/metabolite transporter (DMT)-like permease
MRIARGEVQALIAAALFGASAPLAKAMGLAISPLWGAAILYGGAGISCAAAAWLGRGSEAPLRRADLPWLAAIGIVGGFVGPVLLLIGLARMDAAAATLLLNLEAPLTAAIAVFAFREHLGARGVAGVVAVVAGAAVLVEPGARGQWSGAAAVAVACLAWAVDNNLTAQLSGRDPRAVAAAKGLCGAAISLVLAVATGDPPPAFHTAAFGMLLGALSYGGSLVLYVRAQRELGAARTGALFATAPFLGAILAVATAAGGGARTAGAAALMAVGVALIARSRHEHEHLHAPLEHEHLHVHDDHHRHAHLGSEGPEPHSHPHHHDPIRHAHAHASDVHHRHEHGGG